MTQNKDEGATYVTQPAASIPDVLDISELLSTNPFNGVEQDLTYSASSIWINRTL